MTATAIKPVINSSNAIHLILQGKGGVGKSLVSSYLAQYFMSIEGAAVQCFDTDPVNQTLLSFKALQAEHVNLLDGSKIDERNFDALTERLTTENNIFIIDNGASSFIPLTNYLIENRIIEMLRERGKEVFIHCVVIGGQALDDTISGFVALAEQTNTKNNIVVWLNEYFGAIEYKGKQFTDMRAYTENVNKVRGIIKLVKRNPDTFGVDIHEMHARKFTFDEAIISEEFYLMAKQRIKIVQRDVFSQLEAVEF